MPYAKFRIQSRVWEEPLRPCGTCCPGDVSIPCTGSSLVTWPCCCVVTGWRRRMPLLLPPCRVLAPGPPPPSPHPLPAGSLICGLICSQARVNLGSAQPQGSGSRPVKPGGSAAGAVLAPTCGFADFAGLSLKSSFLLLSCLMSQCDCVGSWPWPWGLTGLTRGLPWRRTDSPFMVRRFSCSAVSGV